MRIHLALGASLFFLLACGDDSGGSGGSGTTTGTTTAPSSSPSSTSTTTGDGGGTTATTGTGGEGGAGGQGGAGSTGSAGGPSDTVQEACEQLNATYDALAEDLGCPVTPGNCDVPADPCDPELIAFLDCLRMGTTAADCVCAEDPENPSQDLLTCTIGECQGENDELIACLDS